MAWWTGVDLCLGYNELKAPSWTSGCCGEQEEADLLDFSTVGDGGEFYMEKGFGWHSTGTDQNRREG